MSSLKCWLSKIEKQDKISKEDLNDILTKLEGHDEAIRAKTIDEYKNLIIKNLDTLTLGNETQAKYIRIHIEGWAEELKEGE